MRRAIWLCALVVGCGSVAEPGSAGGAGGAAMGTGGTGNTLGAMSTGGTGVADRSTGGTGGDAGMSGTGGAAAGAGGSGGSTGGAGGMSAPTCGTEGLACCPLMNGKPACTDGVLRCDASTNTCVSCGILNLGCCSAPHDACGQWAFCAAPQSGYGALCRACGHDGEPACPTGPACEDDGHLRLTEDGKCEQCGQIGQRCCPDSSETGSHCNMGQCIFGGPGATVMTCERI